MAIYPANATTLDIWNLAFTRLGVPTVTSTASTATRAVRAAAAWDLWRPAWIMEHEWSGLCDTIELDTEDSGDPVDRWDYQYDLSTNDPDFTDLLRILRVNGEEREAGSDRWEIHLDADRDKRFLLTDAAPSVYVECLFDYPEPASSDSLGMLIGMSAANAMGMCFADFLAPIIGLAQNSQLIIKQDAARALRVAKSIDGREGSPKLFGDEPLVDARL